MTNGPIEPDANTRAYAKVMHQTFIALTLEGFSEQQALTIIGQIIYSSWNASGEGS